MSPSLRSWGWGKFIRRPAIAPGSPNKKIVFELRPTWAFLSSCSLRHLNFREGFQWQPDGGAPRVIRGFNG